LSGWDMYPEQINWLRNDATRRVSPNAIMRVDDLDIYTVSDSTRDMRSLGKSANNRDIEKELELRNEHCKVDAESGATANILIKHIIEAGEVMKIRNNGGPPLAGTMLHVTWNLNEVFEDKLILGDYNDIMQVGLKLLLDGMAQYRSLKQTTIMQHFSDSDGSAVFRIFSNKVVIWTDSRQHRTQFDLVQTSSQF
jgi:hypothetical protein